MHLPDHTPRIVHVHSYTNSQKKVKKSIISVTLKMSCGLTIK